MTDEMRASDRLYYGIEALKGWSAVLQDVRDPWREGDNAQQSIGAIVSTLLLAGGEEREPIAVSGALDENGQGDVAIVYDGLVVTLSITDSSALPGSAQATIHTFKEITALRVVARHNYYAGTDQRPRHNGLRFAIEVSGREVMFEATPWSKSPLVNDDAIFGAFQTIRDSRLKAE